MKYEQPFGDADPNAPYINRDLATGTQGSRVPAAAIEHHQRELVKLVTAGGLTPSGSDLEQVAKAIRSQKMNYRVAGGTANAITITLDPAPVSYTELEGVPLRLKVTAANTGAATLNVNGLGTKPVVRSDGSALKASDFVVGHIVPVIYDGTSFRILGVLSREIISRINAGKTAVSYSPGSYSWVCPADVHFVEVEMWGAGGGGGGTGTSASKAAGGGGGAYAYGIVPVTPGVSYAIAVGAGGSGGSGGAAGSSGGTTSFGSTLLVASGGTGGTGANNGVTAVQVGGGTSSASGTVLGTMLFIGSVGSEGSNGQGGGSPRGGMPQPRPYTTANNNNAGNIPGGGAPGGSDYSGFSQVGGVGGDGRLILRFAS